MVKLTVADLPILAPLLTRCIEDACTGDRTTVDYSLSALHVNVEAGVGDVFVNSISEPVSVLVIGSGQSPTYSERFCSIALMYTLPEHRTPDTEAEFFRMGREYALEKGCDVFYASRWDCNGSNTPDDLWTRNGFKKQETLFVQHLKK